MERTFKPPGGLTRALVEWRAGQIADPVARLRFLRHSVGDRAIFKPADLWSRIPKRTYAVFGAALFLIPVVTIGDAGRFFRRGGITQAHSTARAVTDATKPAVWLVENGERYEVWSNGLRIERRTEIASEPRAYLAFPAGKEDHGSPEPRTQPAGIVYHTTESHQAPFEESQRNRLTLIGESLLSFVREQKAYNYVVDRFGRVFRIVKETDVAYHAGHSIWGDDRASYVNLNDSFLGVAVEGQSQPAEGASPANPAQIHALRILTEMLRARYHIPPGNCITHAQVSVSPVTRLVSYHTDWAAHFPYAELGLPDNYSIPLPSMARFGFGYDPGLQKLSGGSFWQGLLHTEERVRQDASAHGTTIPRYRETLLERYRQLLNQVKAKSQTSQEKAG